MPRLIIVDDHPLFRSAIANLLQRLEQNIIIEEVDSFDALFVRYQMKTKTERWCIHNGGVKVQCLRLRHEFDVIEHALALQCVSGGHLLATLPA